MDYSKRHIDNNIFAGLFLICLFIGSIAGMYSVFMKPRPDTNKTSTSDTTTSGSSSEVNSPKDSTKPSQDDLIKTESSDPSPKLYTVLSVTDGDTIRIDYDGTNTPLRIIGIDTPETVDERTTVQCFGQEASDYLKSKLTGKKVSIESDPTQSDRDKYNRLLRYVYLDGKDIGLDIITNGYGHEYTYNVPYNKQAQYKTAESTAEQNNLGLWAPTACNNVTSPSSTPSPTATEPAPVTTAPAPVQTTNCNIKGNISNKGEKIYHVPGQQYYDVTKITESKGERYFCSEAEAQAAGWRRSKV